MDKMLQRRNQIQKERESETLENSYTSDSVDRFNSPAFNTVNAPLPGATLIKINIDDIDPSPIEYNFFAAQSEDHVMNLAISLKSEGQLSPIIVREQVVDESTRRWQNLAGHTRVRAAQYLRDEGFTEFQYLYAFAYPLHKCSDTQAHRIIVHSNTEQRQSLSADEKLKCFYFEYCDEKNNDRNETAKELMEKLMDRYQIKRSQAYNLRKIGEELIPEFKGMLQFGNISIRNAITLVKFEKEIQQWLFDNYKDQLTRDMIPQLSGKGKEEIIELFRTEPSPDHEVKKYFTPKTLKKVEGGSLTRIFVPEGKEEEIFKLLEKYYNDSNG